MPVNLKEEYTRRHKGLQEFARRIEQDLKEIFEGMPHIDRITARAKDIDKFLAKANKKNDRGMLKYRRPLVKIQDQVGARVIVFYKEDLLEAEKRVLDVYNEIQKDHRTPEFVNQFGYEGIHFIVHIPPEIRPLRDELKIGIDFFELQLRTLYQHAWSEASHDIAYKPEQELEPYEKKAIAYTAAQSWGADQVFQQVLDGTFQEGENDDT